MAFVPKDDDFWYELSGSVVTNSITRLNDAAKKLYDFTTWTFPIFTASTIFSFAVNKPNEILIYLTPLPYILLSFGLVECVAAQMPKSVDFFYNVPKSISNAYETSFIEKQKKLQYAKYWVFFGVIASAFIIFYSFIFSKKNELEAKNIDTPKEIYFTAGYYEKFRLYDVISTVGFLPQNTTVGLKASFLDALTKKETIVYEKAFTTAKDGTFQYNFGVKKLISAGKILITLDWKDDIYSRSLTREINVYK